MGAVGAALVMHNGESSNEVPECMNQIEACLQDAFWPLEEV